MTNPSTAPVASTLGALERAAPAPVSEPLRPSRSQRTISTAALVSGAHKYRRDRPEHDPGGIPQDAVPRDDRRCARRLSPTPPLPLAEASPPRDLALAGVRYAAPQAISALHTDCPGSAKAVNGPRRWPGCGR